MPAGAKPIAVVGIGNSLLTDDGAGIHTLTRFSEDNTYDDVVCVDGGTVGSRTPRPTHEPRRSRRSRRHEARQGTGRRHGAAGEDMDTHLRQQHGSVHEVGLSDLLDALRLRGELPEKRALIGIEPANMDWGTEPTPPVAAALPEAADCARKLVRWRRWRAERLPNDWTGRRNRPAGRGRARQRAPDAATKSCTRSTS